MGHQMRPLGRVVAQIPARAGSERVPHKNLRYLAGKPMLQYAFDAIFHVDEVHEVVLNTDSPVLASLAAANHVGVYRRPTELGHGSVTGDAFTADFLEHHNVDTLVMVNPVCPLITPDDIRAALSAFAASTCDTLISCTQTRMQVFYAGAPVNISLDGPLTPTQINPPVDTLNWAVTVWDAALFRAHYAQDGHAYLGRNRVLFPIDPLHGIKVSDEADFQLAQAVLRARDDHEPPRYWSPSA